MKICNLCNYQAPFNVHKAGDICPVCKDGMLFLEDLEDEED